MQDILTIDATLEPAVVTVARVVGRSVEVIESHRIDLLGAFSRENLFKRSATDAASPESEVPPGPDTPSSPSSSGGATPLPADLLAPVKTPWTASVLIIPAWDYHSLNLDLPFGDTKNIRKVIDLEVQDVVPFDLEEFLIQHHTVSPSMGSPSTGGAFDVHVSLIPRVVLQNILRACAPSGIEPVVVSTPSSAVGALYHLAPDSVPENSAVILSRPPFFGVAISFDGILRTDRLIDRSILNGSTDAREQVLSELKLTLAAAERRYQRTVERVFLLGDGYSTGEIQQALARNVEALDLSFVKGSSSPDTALPAMSAVFAQDTQAPSILTNFRTREFAYSVRLSELVRGLRSLAPFALGLALVILISTGATWWIREHRIGGIEGAIRDQIMAVIPELTAEPGREFEALQVEFAQIDRDLKNLGSPAATSPLEALVAVSRDLPAAAGSTVQSVDIKGNKMTFEVTVPKYGAGESIQKALEKRRQVYCRVRRESGGSSPQAGPIAYRFEVWLCE